MQMHEHKGHMHMQMHEHKGHMHMQMHEHKGHMHCKCKFTVSNSHQKPGLDSQRPKHFASNLQAHSVNYAAKLVKSSRRVLSNIILSNSITNSHQEPVSGQACNLLVRIRYPFPFSVVKETLITQ
jgi:hypothetical protein